MGRQNKQPAVGDSSRPVISKKKYIFKKHIFFDNFYFHFCFVVAFYLGFKDG